MKTIVALVFAAVAFPAAAQTPDQIDYLLRFASPAAALAAGELAGVVIPACSTCSPPTPVTFSGAQVIAPVLVWETTAIAGDGTETRTYLAPTQYWVLVSTVGRNAGIEASAALELEVDRTLACSGAPVGQWMLANNTGVTPAALGSGTLPTYHIEPMFAGSQSCYHLGGGS